MRTARTAMLGLLALAAACAAAGPAGASDCGGPGGWSYSLVQVSLPEGGRAWLGHAVGDACAAAEGGAGWVCPEGYVEHDLGTATLQLGGCGAGAFVHPWAEPDPEGAAGLLALLPPL